MRKSEGHRARRGRARRRDSRAGDVGRVSRDDAHRAAVQELRVHAADRRRAAVHRRSRRLRGESRPRRQGRHRPAERGAEAGRAREADPGQARRLGGWADAGGGVGRGDDEARQVESRQRDHRRDGVERDDPDGAVGHDPEPHRADLADVERAADQRHRRQRLPLARVSRPTRCRARCSPRRSIDAFGKGATINVGARNDAFGMALKQLFVTQFKKLGGKVGVNISWNPDQANFDSEMGQLVGGNPKGWVIIDFPETFQKYAAVARAHRQVGCVADVHDRGAPQHDGPRRDRQPGRRAPRHRRQRRGRPGGRVVRRVLEEARDGREAVHRLRGHGARRGERRVPRRAEGMLVVAGEDQGESRRGVRAARASRSPTCRWRRRSS